MLKTKPDRLLLPLWDGGLFYIDLEHTKTTLDDKGKDTKEFRDKQSLDLDIKKMNDDPKYRRELE